MGIGFGVAPPVKEGERYDVKIEDIGKEGDGVAKVNNFVVFIPNTKVGDEVKIEVTKVLRTLAFGQVVDDSAPVEEDTEEEYTEEEDEDIEAIELD